MFGIHRPVKKESLVFDGIPYTLYRSHRRTLSLQCKDTGELVVRAPYFCPARDIEKAIATHRDWILQKLEAIALAREESSRPETHYFDGALLPFFEKSVILCCQFNRDVL